MRKVYLDDLPRYTYQGREVIDYLKSIGYKVLFIYYDIMGYVEIVDYDGKTQYLYIKYLDKELFRIRTSDFLKCKISKLLGKRTKEFKAEIGQTFKDENRDITIIDREYKIDNNGRSRKWYKYHCNKCGWTEGWIEESGLLRGNNCSCCTNQTVVEGINDIPTTAPWMIPYFQGGYKEAKLYTCQSNKKITPICPDCGRIKDKPISINNIFNSKSISCICSDGISYPNKFMFNLLEQLNLEFIPEYSPDWIKPKRYDFYIPSMNLIIEMDGKLGHGKSVYDKSKLTIEESKHNDDYKNIKANENNNKIVRINCDKSELEFIKQNILSYELNESLDLSVIDWLKCEEFALSNRVKEACKYWNSGVESTKEIAEIMKISKNTVIKYLKKGSRIWEWCNYNAKEEMKNNGGLNSKQVEVFKNGVSFGIFSSCCELERQSEKLFEVKLNHSKISAVAIGKQKIHKGFIFQYI